MATRKFKQPKLTRRQVEKLTPAQVKSLLPGGKLEHGSHDSAADGVCLMEAVAWVTGEPHSDHPECADPTLTEIAISLNDDMDDDERQDLIAVIPALVGSKTGSKRVLFQRARAAVVAALAQARIVVETDSAVFDEFLSGLIAEYESAVKAGLKSRKDLKHVAELISIFARFSDELSVGFDRWEMDLESLEELTNELLREWNSDGISESIASSIIESATGFLDEEDRVELVRVLGSIVSARR